MSNLTPLNMDVITLQSTVEPGDILKGKKRGWPFLDHYITYLGSEHGFITTTWSGGVQTYSFENSATMLEDFRITEIKKFDGTSWELQNLIRRALSQRGRPYSVLGFNCEHLANFVRTGKSFSRQVGWLFLIVFALAIGWLFLVSSRKKVQR